MKTLLFLILAKNLVIIKKNIKKMLQKVRENGKEFNRKTINRKASMVY